MDISDLKYIAKAGIGDKGSRNNVDTEQYYFNHIPKTGGTTLRYMLYEYFGGDNIYPNAYDYFIKNKGAYLTWSEFQPIRESVIDKHALLMGHYDIKPIALYSQKPKVFSFFRNPMDCIVSSINYNMIRGRRHSQKTLDEVLETELWREGSMQAKHMGYNRKKPNIEEVIKNIEKLDCIGIAEDFERSITLLNKHFGWNLIIKKPKNVTKKRMPFSKKQIETIQESLEVDQLVYDTALASFRKRCEKFGL